MRSETLHEYAYFDDYNELLTHISIDFEQHFSAISNLPGLLYSTIFPDVLSMIVHCAVQKCGGADSFSKNNSTFINTKIPYYKLFLIRIS